MNEINLYFNLIGDKDLYDLFNCRYCTEGERQSILSSDEQKELYKAMKIDLKDKERILSAGFNENKDKEYKKKNDYHINDNRKSIIAKILSQKFDIDNYDIDDEESFQDLLYSAREVRCIRDNIIYELSTYFCKCVKDYDNDIKWLYNFYSYMTHMFTKAVVIQYKVYKHHKVNILTYQFLDHMERMSEIPNKFTKRTVEARVKEFLKFLDYNHF